MNKVFYSIVLVVMAQSALSLKDCKCQGVPEITGLTYDSITPTGVVISWTTNFPADSKIRWMAPDSNYQPLIFTDSLYSPELVTGHALAIGGLKPATIYQYRVISQSTGGAAIDSGYFITQSVTSHLAEVYFNHTVDTTVSAGEHANGSTNFENLLNAQISKATHSIDITLWEFSGITSVAQSLVAAKNRGVRIRFIYDSAANTPLIDMLEANGIPVLKRNYLANFSMHDKYWIFDYQDTSNQDNKYLWTGSTNVSHAMFHQDRNNIILIRDKALCAVYTREFEEMWGSHGDQPDPGRAKFGPGKTDNVPHIVNVAGIRMEVYFAPTDSITDTICSIIGSRATKSICFCMYKFELPPVEEALHLIYNDGKHLSGVFDSSQSVAHNSAFPRMKGHPVPGTWDPPADVFIDTIPGLLHHKYFLTDADSSGGNMITVTGSFNWEIPAQTGNDENILVIHDPRVTNLYFQEFCARYRESGGYLIGIGIGDQDRDRTERFSVGQNYPNPFQNETRIRFAINRPCHVKLVVFDLMGREVQTLVNETLQPGTHERLFDGSSLKSMGLFYKITAGDYSVTKKMMLHK